MYRRRRSESRDHPRVCGEKAKGTKEKVIAQESPPRMRGKRKGTRPDPENGGIIPACAGKRPKQGRSSTRIWDHPRVCGEKPVTTRFASSFWGSPPRMRGKVFFFTGASFCAIFFLEPSGNLLLEPSGSSWVPPDGSIFVFAIGLLPRVRGKAITFREQDSADGITPAYAGKRWTPCHTEPCT